MRVISGSAKGKRLEPPEDRRIRPTSDRIKEALFSIIYSLCGELGGKTVLDLFAGTGNLGIEALSRGASRAVFIDSGKASINLIRTNIKLTGFFENSEIILADVFQAVSSLAEKNCRFDLIFADPPYGLGLAEKLIVKLGEVNLLYDGAIVVVETGVKEQMKQIEGNLRLIDKRIYGDTALAFFEFND